MLKPIMVRDDGKVFEAFGFKKVHSNFFSTTINDVEYTIELSHDDYFTSYTFCEDICAEFYNGTNGLHKLIDRIGYIR